MGGLVDSLTKTGLEYPPDSSDVWGGSATNRRKFFNSRGAAGMDLARQAAATAAPSIATIQGNLPEPSIVPGREVLPGPVEASLPTEDYVPGPSPIVGMNQPTTTPLPRMFKPSFAEASTNTSGMPAKNAPGLTRLGKLVQVLGLAAQGAATGQAASEQALAASGGHRAGGWGTGFMAGLQEPARQASIQQQVQRGALQNEAERQQIGMLPWLRAMQVRREQAQINADNALAAWRQWQMENGGKASEAEQIGAKQRIAQEAGLDPEEAKQFVYGIHPTKDAAQPHDELSVWREQHPNEPIENYWKSKQRLHPGASENEFRMWMGQHPGSTVDDYWKARAETPKPPTRGQEAAVIVREKKAYRDLEREWRWDKGSNAYVSNKTYEQLTPDEFNAKKQAIEDAKKEELSVITGQPQESYDYSAQGTSPAPKAATAPAAGPQKGAIKMYQGHPYRFDGSKWVLSTAVAQ